MKNQLKPITGITLPVRNNAKEIQASVCAISDYLGNHLPAIIKSLKKEPKDGIIENANRFNTNFIAAVRQTNISQHTQPCSTSLTISDDYRKKIMGLRIINSSRRWVEGFMHTNSSFLIFLCLFTAQAASRAVENVQCTGALRPSLRLMSKSTEELLRRITNSEELPSTCPPLNTTELVRPGQQPPTAHQLSSIRCEMMELSKLIPKLKEDLLTISQFSLQVEKSFGGPTPSQNCSLPHFEQQMEINLYAKCLLQLLDQQLSKIQCIN
eukprot:superscaffoldBa00002172_g13429